MRPLKRGEVVFDSPDHFWRTFVGWKENPGECPGFGQWGDFLNEVDPFRDGLAAQRIGDYLKWILDGYRAGRPKDDLLAEAAQRYARAWGRDKVLSVNCALVMQQQ